MSSVPSSSTGLLSKWGWVMLAAQHTAGMGISSSTRLGEFEEVEARQLG